MTEPYYYYFQLIYTTNRTRTDIPLIHIIEWWNNSLMQKEYKDQKTFKNRMYQQFKIIYEQNVWLYQCPKKYK